MGGIFAIHMLQLTQGQLIVNAADFINVMLTAAEVTGALYPLPSAGT